MEVQELFEAISARSNQATESSMHQETRYKLISPTISPHQVQIFALALNVITMVNANVSNGKNIWIAASDGDMERVKV